MIDAAPTSDELLQAALGYARDGWAVLPLHTPINGVCDCSAGPACGRNTGKHPWTKNGLKDATTDELKIRRWWKERPIANIGLAVPEGYVVVDVDGQHGYAGLKEKGWSLGTTAVQSSGKGAHYAYRTRNRIPPRSKIIDDSEEGAHDGVDLRGPGSYILGAPSLHPTGRVYEWSVPLSQIEIAPPWLEEISKHTGGTQIGDRAPVDFNVVLAGLPDGQRKWELYRAACKLRAANVPFEMAVMLAQQAAANCAPPLEAKEAARKVKEAYDKYPPNAEAKDLPAGVTLLGFDSVMVEFEDCRFVFSDLEKSGRELHAEMEVQNLLPGLPREPYIQRLNLLSISSREACRREIEHVLGSTEKGKWTALISRAVTHAQNAYLSVDRSIRSSDIEAPDALRFVIPDICVDDGFSIMFGAGSSLKTWLLMKMALAVSRGDPFLGRPVERRNVLYIDFETGEKTFGYRMRRICASEGGTLEDARDVRFWNGKGLSLEDQVESIKRCCEENQIGFLCLDHIAAACSGDANEQSVATRFARAVGKIGLPMMALAHITGAGVRDPEQAEKPFGSIFWENLSRRTIFILRQQEAESLVADLGLYPKKVNDGGRPKPFGAKVTFVDPSGPVAVEPDGLGGKGILSAVRGFHHVLWDLLAEPMLAEEIAEATGKSDRHCKDTMKAHPRMFIELSGRGQGVKSMWQRIEPGRALTDDSTVEDVEDDSPW